MTGIELKLRCTVFDVNPGMDKSFGTAEIFLPLPAKKPERQKNVDLRCRKRYNLSCERTKAVLSALFSICFGVTFFRIPDIMLRERF